MGRTREELRKLDYYHNPKRKQTLFRLWSDDRRKLLKKLIEEDMRMQTVIETIVLAYIRNDRRVMDLLKENAVKGLRKNSPRRKEWGIEAEDASKILEQLAKESPLQDKDIPFNQ